MSVRWKNPVVWLRGLLAAFIGGGAGAISSGVVAGLKTPEQYNLNSGLGNILTLMGGTFIMSGIFMAAAYLSKSPLPEVVENGTDFFKKPEPQGSRPDIGLDQPPKP